MATQKLNAIQLRLTAVSLLRDLKSIYTYKQLSQLLGFPESLLCRYVSGTTIPSESNSQIIIEKLSNPEVIASVVHELISIESDGYVDTSKIYLYPQLLEISLNVLLTNKKCSADSYDKVITVIQNGVPLAALVAHITKKPLVIVKKRKESVTQEYYEEPIRESDGSISFLYLRKDLVQKGDRFLFVDDLIRTGRTLSSVRKLVERAGGAINGALVLISVDESFSSLQGLKVCKLL
ncbi:MAG: phosphoribosyltransferase [Sulfolobales archaeon]|nr:phosphoribosyltransferase [Sulfolobales archaeon]MCG2883705.1 phosphoribosyltransferase [Sulfolobales archaeon]MCG2908347.1 phosphoribosyltransferase [Sulfolobales archaeon]